ncbi:hypothetical protein AGMMS49992_04130 [Clostridia bacterium]|nr:hypothetical protein AGMMS49992_04130 [Clostridia bacterium]
MNWMEDIPETISSKYEIHNYNHAAEILSQAFAQEYSEVLLALDKFSITTADMISGGGSESQIPRNMSGILRPMNWQEVRIAGDLLVKAHYRQTNAIVESTVVEFIQGHNIDYVKNRIALDLEWNSKDQTFDRDLFAFRTFYECGIISCGIIITRSENLNPIFRKLGIMKKYGASTTWMGKLLPRLQSRRHGGCPLLVFGITSAVISDLEVE